MSFQRKNRKLPWGAVYAGNSSCWQEDIGCENCELYVWNVQDIYLNNFVENKYHWVDIYYDIWAILRQYHILHIFLISSNENNKINAVYLAKYLSRHTLLHMISVFACHLLKLHVKRFVCSGCWNSSQLVLEPPYIPWNKHMVCQTYIFCGYIVTILWISATYVPYSSRLFHWYCFCHWRKLKNISR